jgi:hypothetical protein
VQLLADRFAVELHEAYPVGPGTDDPILDINGGQVGEGAALASVALAADVVVEFGSPAAAAGGVHEPTAAACAGEQAA